MNKYVLAFLSLLIGFCFGAMFGVSVPERQNKVISVTYTAPLVVTRQVVKEATLLVPVTVEVTKEVVKTVEIPIEVTKENSVGFVSKPVVSQVVVVEDSAYPCIVGQIKGNRNSMIYHIPSGSSYAETRANVVCFNTEDEAVAAGFRKAKK